MKQKPKSYEVMLSSLQKLSPGALFEGCLKDINGEMTEKMERERKEKEKQAESGKGDNQCFLAKHKEDVREIKMLCLSIKRAINATMTLLNLLANLGTTVGQVVERTRMEIVQMMTSLFNIIPKVTRAIVRVLNKLPKLITSVLVFLIRAFDQFADVTQYYWDEKFKLMDELSIMWHTSLAREDDTYLRIKCEQAIRESGVDDVTLAESRRNIGILKGLLEYLELALNLISGAPDSIVKLQVEPVVMNVLSMPSKLAKAINSVVRGLGTMISKLTSVTYWVEQAISASEKMLTSSSSAKEYMDFADQVIDLMLTKDAVQQSEPLIPLPKDVP